MISPPSISAIRVTIRFRNSRSWDVMRSAPAKDFEEVLQPEDRLQVQVVGGLVHEEHVGPAEQDPGQGHPHLPSAGERADVALDPFVVEAQAVQHLARLGLQGVPSEVVVLLLDFTEAVEDVVHLVGAFGIGHRMLEVFELVVE